MNLLHILTCWLIADMITGVGHWLEDRYFTVDMPWIGKHIAAPNELHHTQPRAFLEGGYWHRNWTTIVTAGLGLVVILLTPAWQFWPVFVFVSQANEVHAWAHQKCSKVIDVFQEIGVLQSPRQHSKHHKAPFDCRYCVLTDWLNPILDALWFWFMLELGLSYVGIRPKD